MAANDLLGHEAILHLQLPIGRTSVADWPVLICRFAVYALTQNVLASFAGCEDPRLKEFMMSLVRHLHVFIRDVRLTQEEWNAAIEFLTAVGHITDDKRQEFILLSDVLVALTQTINVNNETYQDATEATVFGPVFFQVKLSW